MGSSSIKSMLRSLIINKPGNVPGSAFAVCYNYY